MSMDFTGTFIRQVNYPCIYLLNDICRTINYVLGQDIYTPFKYRQGSILGSLSSCLSGGVNFLDINHAS